MKKTILFLLVGLSLSYSHAQSTIRDSLNQLLQKEKSDTNRALLLLQLSSEYLVSKPDSAMLMASKGLELSRRINFPKGEGVSLNGIGNVYNVLGNYSKALEVHLKALKVREKINHVQGIANTLNNIGTIYISQEEYRTAFEYFLKSKKLNEQLNNKANLAANLYNLSRCYLGLKQYDSATVDAQEAYEIGRKVDPLRIGYLLSLIATIYSEIGQRKLALEYFRRSIHYRKLNENYTGLSADFLGIAKLFENDGQGDSALFYANKALKIAEEKKITKEFLDAASFLSSFYKKRRNVDSAFFYLELAKRSNDSLFGQQKTKQFQSLAFDEQLRQRDLEAESTRYQNQIRLYILLSAVILFSLIAIFLFRNNKQKQKVNAVLKYQKEKTEKAYEQLQATQAQLIQQEKMASLGELTAGIAHEIQNPLNFVNNFSDVNIELIEEAEQEISNGNIDEVKSALANVKGNEQKINHHGKRADAIVKGMLQHSRANTGKKEPTDINALADEYLRLSYHGLRAKDKDFNADFKIEFDENVGEIELVPQDIGRVLLNLYNNAFYSLSEKKKAAAIKGENYEPTVWVTTKAFKLPFGGLGVSISVKDNGNGIPQKVIDKIFQPFFTTKPTGQGTGLGLSLSYDIIKAHGGEIKVETKEGEGCEFIVQLPT